MHKGKWILCLHNCPVDSAFKYLVSETRKAIQNNIKSSSCVLLCGCWSPIYHARPISKATSTKKLFFFSLKKLSLGHETFPFNFSNTESWFYQFLFWYKWGVGISILLKSSLAFDNCTYSRCQVYIIFSDKRINPCRILIYLNRWMAMPLCKIIACAIQHHHHCHLLCAKFPVTC